MRSPISTVYPEILRSLWNAVEFIPCFVTLPAPGAAMIHIPAIGRGGRPVRAWGRPAYTYR
jgi:hypothetical protein